jgi:hypothetical protein
LFINAGCGIIFINCHAGENMIKVTTAKKNLEGVQLRDLFQTPRYGIEFLIPFLKEAGVSGVWDCAVGEGRISNVLEEHNFKVYRTDIRPTPFVDRVLNFITETETLPPGIDCIVTNPPYSLKTLFIQRAFEYGLKFAFLVPATYSAEMIRFLRKNCQKIVPTSRISYITPRIVARVNAGENASYKVVDEIPQELIYKYSSSQYHSMWLLHGFNLPENEVFVDIPLSARKGRIL